MTRRDTLQCVHEPFGDAWYFGPERLNPRYEDDEKAREESGYADSTYKTIFDRIAREHSEVGTLFLYHRRVCFPSKFDAPPIRPINFISSFHSSPYAATCAPFASHLLP